MNKVNTKDIPTYDNIIGSHSVYKVKFDSINNNGSSAPAYFLKSRLHAHGRRDSEREYMRSNAPVLSHIGFR